MQVHFLMQVHFFPGIYRALKAQKTNFWLAEMPGFKSHLLYALESAHILAFLDIYA